MVAPVVAAVAAEGVKYAAEAAQDFVKGLASDVSSAASSVINFIPSVVSPAYSNALVDRVRVNRAQLVDAVVKDLYAKECHENWYVPCGPIDPASRGGRTASLLDSQASGLGVPPSMRAELRARVYERFHNGPRQAAAKTEALQLKLKEYEQGTGGSGEALAVTPGMLVGGALGVLFGGYLGGKVGAGAGAVAGIVLGRRLKLG